MSLFNLVLFILSYLYFYNVFIILPNFNIPFLNFNIKVLYLTLFQGFFLVIIEKKKLQNTKYYFSLFLLIILPSYLINIKLCLIQIFFPLLWKYLSFDEESKIFSLFFITLWVIFNSLFLIFLIH